MKIYAYKNCDTCRKAKKFLEANEIKHEVIPIREQPPSKSELKAMLSRYDGNIQKLFNTSGGDYKAMKMKEKIPKMTDAEAVHLLSKNGNLIKRPFAIKDDTGTVGFIESVWYDMFL